MNGRFSKKSAGEAVSSLILFIAVVGITILVVLLLQKQTFKSTDIITDKNNLLLERGQTFFVISNINYISKISKLSVFVKNIGTKDNRFRKFRNIFEWRVYKKF